MRIVFAGASAIAVAAARIIARRGHDVVVIDKEDARLEALAEGLDCGRIHGDATRPAVLKEPSPAECDFLFCLTGSDQVNIIASLVGRSLGYRRVVTRIDDPEFEHICIELGLQDAIIPSRTIGRFLSDMIDGRDPLELSAMLKDEAAVFSFVVGEDDAGLLDELALPPETRAVCAYRDGAFEALDGGFKLKPGDELVLITRRSRLPALSERWRDGGSAPET
jgi:trk system potassium uptake protein TrkA